MSQYLILGVSYSKEENHIDWVVITREIDGKLFGFFVVSREFAVDLIKTETASFRTVTMDLEKRKYYKGAEVHVYGDEFLITAPDSKEENNLENLPAFEMPGAQIEEELKKVFLELFDFDE